AGRIHYHRATGRWHPGNTGNKGLFLCSLFSDSDSIGLAGIPRCADINVVTTSREISSGTAPNCNVVVPASVSFQRLEALRRAVKQRLKTDSGVEATADVAGERSRTHRCIIDSIETIVGERSETDTGVVAAICVGCERAIAGRGVVVAGRVVDEGVNTGRGV